MCLRCAELYAVTRLRGEALITGPQIRAARGFLAWDRRDLAKKAVVTIYTVERIETGAEISGTAMVKGLAAIIGALEAEGIEFIDDADAPGVRIHLKKSKVRAKSK
jgi:transcriptional regulator with XRE-family HTH domain